jgi:hypothetical protein
LVTVGGGRRGDRRHLLAGEEQAAVRDPLVSCGRLPVAGGDNRCRDLADQGGLPGQGKRCRMSATLP